MLHPAQERDCRDNDFLIPDLENEILPFLGDPSGKVTELCLPEKTTLLVWVLSYRLDPIELTRFRAKLLEFLENQIERYGVHTPPL